MNGLLQSPGAYTGPQGQFPGVQGAYPGVQGAFPGAPGGFPGPQGAFPGAQGAFPGAPGGFPGPQGAFPGAPGAQPGMSDILGYGQRPRGFAALFNALARLGFPIGAGFGYPMPPTPPVGGVQPGLAPDLFGMMNPFGGPSGMGYPGGKGFPGFPGPTGFPGPYGPTMPPYGEFGQPDGQWQAPPTWTQQQQ